MSEKRHRAAGRRGRAARMTVREQAQSQRARVVWPGIEGGAIKPLSDRELAEMEYWPLERKKLAATAPPPLQGQIAFVTGAAGAIGCGVIEALLERGACVFATDIDGERLAVVADRFASQCDRIAMAVGDA